uniref:CSON000443 protein n=1 Tax=Culicoides sonorensis TaxID=179676 RepID=A0A336KVV6_CULSO
MEVNKYFVSFLILVIYQISLCSGGATLEQMEKAAGLMRTACVNKFKISDAEADSVKAGNIPTEKNLKCYVHCVFEMMGAMKKAKVNYEGMMKQIDTLMPDEMKEPTKKTFGLCKDSTQGIKDPCEAGATLLKCVKDNAEVFTFA